MRGAAGRAWPRALVWLQLTVGWLPVLALYTALVFTQHQPVSVPHAAALAILSLIHI